MLGVAAAAAVDQPPQQTLGLRAINRGELCFVRYNRHLVWVGRFCDVTGPLRGEPDRWFDLCWSDHGDGPPRLAQRWEESWEISRQRGLDLSRVHPGLLTRGAVDPRRAPLGEGENVIHHFQCGQGYLCVQKLDRDHDAHILCLKNLLADPQAPAGALDLAEPDYTLDGGILHQREVTQAELRARFIDTAHMHIPGLDGGYGLGGGRGRTRETTISIDVDRDLSDVSFTAMMLDDEMHPLQSAEPMVATIAPAANTGLPDEPLCSATLQHQVCEAPQPQTYRKGDTIEVKLPLSWPDDTQMQAVDKAVLLYAFA